MITDQNDLYGLPLESFVSSRAKLAKALRKDGRREQAGEVSSLPKPSVAAWAVNQLVRTRRREVAALLDAGDGLRHAQLELLAGRGDGSTLRDAVARERDAVGELVQHARGLLSSDGHELSQTTLDRVSETLHAAALDEDARAEVRPGCLARELRHVGLGPSGGAGQPASRASTGPQPRARRSAAPRAVSTPSTSTARTREPDAAHRAEAKRADRERAARLKATRQAEADARRAAERAQRELHAAQARRDAAAASLREAEDALAAARERAERATPR